MAKLQECYSINRKYTNPFSVKFNIYVAGVFELHTSYYTITVNDAEVSRFTFNTTELEKIRNEITEYISFIECEKFDTITYAELKFMGTDDFYDFYDLLVVHPFELNRDLSICSFGRNSFTTKDCGKKFYGYHSRVGQSTGTFSLKWNDKDVKVPFAAAANNNMIEIKEINTDFNLLKLLFFNYKLYILHSFLYEKEYNAYSPRLWKANFRLNLYDGIMNIKEIYPKLNSYYAII